MGLGLPEAVGLEPQHSISQSDGSDTSYKISLFTPEMVVHRPCSVSSRSFAAAIRLLPHFQALAPADAPPESPQAAALISTVCEGSVVEEGGRVCENVGER